MSSSDDAGEGFVGAKAKGVLAKDRALIEIWGNEVSGDSNNFHSLVVGLAVGRGAWERREERGMNIEDTIFPVPNKVGRKNFHKAGENDEFDVCLF